MRRRTRRRLAEVTGFVVGLAGVTGVAVAASRGDEARAPDAEAIYRVELASYEKALAAWRRDSAVIDSVSRTIDTDTVYRLYRRVLTAPDPAALYQEIACEEWRLGHRHRPVPTKVALRRMLDTLWRPEDADRLRELQERFPKTGHVTVGHWSCGYPGEHVGPAEAAGASMVIEKPRPREPKPPGR